MTIPDDEIISDEEVGKQGDKTVRALRTVGGLFLIEARSTKGQRTILGAGNHPCIARMLAQKLNQDVEFNDLHKSQDTDESTFAEFLPFWEAVTLRAKGR